MDAFLQSSENEKNKPNPIFEGEINFLGTLDMLQNILKELPIDYTNSIIFQDGNIYKFRIHKKSDIKIILDYLYLDSSFYLERKFQKYLENKKYLQDFRKVKNVSL